ncbi:terminase small subunit, partial [Erwinia amylovora]|uniref:terminase small subunit n=1 Tax=Erwinia amylovora TaxID=552 RepID=UPI0020C15FCA
MPRKRSTAHPPKVNGQAERVHKFATKYTKDFNATQAAIRAGYSKKTAHSQGSRLLKRVEVQDLLRKATERRVA